MGKKLSFHVTYKNERISIKTAYLKMCVTSLLCGPRADLWPFYGFLYQRFYKGLSYSLISEEEGEPWDEDAQQKRKSSLRKISSPLAP